jgi:hypothetical protein
MSLLNKQLITINGDLFLLKQCLSEEKVKDVDTIKVWCSADHVFKKEGQFFFCEKIQELEEEQFLETNQKQQDEQIDAA